MVFIAILVLSALAVAGSAAFFSIYGLAQVFSGAFWSVVIMGSSLELGKLIAASFLYRFWDKTSKVLKTYMSTAIVILMLITSLGIFGFLTAAYQIDSLDLRQQEETIALYETQKEYGTNRLIGINQQIEEVPDAYVTKRMELVDKFAPEKEEILNSISEIDKKLLELKTQQLQTEAKIGPIIYVAEVLDREADDAVFWFVLMIIFVFDPLAVSLTLAANIAIKQRIDLKKNPAPDDKSGKISNDGLAELSEKIDEMGSELKRGRIRDNLGNIIRSG